MPNTVETPMPTWAGTAQKPQFNREDFAYAVCTVDGQQLSSGSKALKFPIMEAVMPLIYAIALKDCGVAEVNKVLVRVGVES